MYGLQRLQSQQSAQLYNCVLPPNPVIELPTVDPTETSRHLKVCFVSGSCSYDMITLQLLRY